MQRLLPNMVVFLSRTGDASMLGAARIRSHFRRYWGRSRRPRWPPSLPDAAAVLLQTKFLLHWGALEPKVSRVSPMAGLKRVFGFDGLVEMVKSLIKLGLLSAAIWIAIRGDWNGLMHLPVGTAHFAVGGLAAGVSPVYRGCRHSRDHCGGRLFWVRFRHARDMRMSKQDIRDETKDTEGTRISKREYAGFD